MSPTLVVLDPDELARRWHATDGSAQRTRELSVAGRVLFTVDFAETAGYLLQATGLGRVLVTPDGGELLCQPEPRTPGWSTLLAAQALPLAATLQGLEVLHSSGVVVRGAARLFAGSPGAGKSSLAAALVVGGAELLGDDAIAIAPHDGSLIAHPGAGVLHLRPPEHERLSASDRSKLGRSDTHKEAPPGQAGEAAPRPNGRRRYTRRLADAAPVGELFLLERSPTGPVIERLKAVDPFVLLATTFNLSVRTADRLRRHLETVALIAKTTRVYRLRLTPGMNASDVAGALTTHFAREET